MNSITLPEDWKTILETELQQNYFKVLSEIISTAYARKTIYPPANLLFRAFELCPFESLKVVIIGQDPYHQNSQAHGLSFSVNDGIRIPPSLINIFKELKNDIPGFEIPNSGNLEKWASQGVLLLNAILSVEDSLPGSHKNVGWQSYTDAVIKAISDQKQNVVFLLWGAFAINKSALIDSSKHLILTAAHPSPLARGAFFGNKHFSQTNNYLINKGLKPIDWNLT